MQPKKIVPFPVGTYGHSPSVYGKRESINADIRRKMQEVNSSFNDGVLQSQ
jgi:hypothetical protein